MSAQLCDLDGCTNLAVAYVEGQYAAQFVCAAHKPADVEARS